MTNGSTASALTAALGAEQHDDEAAEHVERDVAGEHVGEQTHRMTDGTRQEGDDLDRHDQRQYVDRHAGRDEQLEEVEPVLFDADDDDGEKHHERQAAVMMIWLVTVNE